MVDQNGIRRRVAARLRAWRTAQRPPLTQPEAADRIRADGRPIGYRQYQRWEAEVSTPAWPWLEAIAAEVGIAVDELIGIEAPAEANGRDAFAEIVDRLERVADRLEQVLAGRAS